MNISETIPSNNQEIIFEVGYYKIERKDVIIYPLTGMILGYLTTQSLITTIAYGALGLMASFYAGIGHASLLTPQKKIGSLSSLVYTYKEKPKVYAATSNDPTKNPRVHFYFKATPEQIKLIENSRFVPGFTCSDGCFRLLAKAGLPHVFFPLSLSPTLSAYYLEKREKKDNAIRVKYINWENEQKVEKKIASIIETLILTTVFTLTSIVVAAEVSRFFGYFPK